MNEEKLTKLVAYYQQKLADATLEIGQLTVAHNIAAEENVSLRTQLEELSAVPAPAE